MLRLRLVVLCSAAIPLAIGAALPAPDSLEWVVLLRRVGPVHFGMRTAAAERALNARFDGVSRSECEYARTSSMPAGLRFMVEKGRIVRADVDSAGVLTGSGAEVGMTEAEIHALYSGRIRTEPHKYTGPEGHYLVYTPRDPPDRRYGLIFETDGKVVIRYRTGLRPAVEYVEGCS